MRITNSIMTNNTKTNINLNKVEADRLNTMVASGQKITRPSDDPVIAIRALRLNSSMSTLNQYYEKNIPDASAWYKTTETALTQTDTVITKIREQLTTGASDENTAEDRTNILEELKSLRDQIYASGNADYAGRTVFTGYRTGEMLTFLEKETKQYRIYEPMTQEAAEKFTYVSGIQEINKDTLSGYVETDVKSHELYRVKLAYDKVDVSDEAGNPTSVYLRVSPNDGPADTPAITASVVSIDGLTQAQLDELYTGLDASGNPSATYTKPVVVAETGELLLDETDYNTLKASNGFTAEYFKSEWVRNDLRPEHYFMCDSAGIEYNYNRIDPTTKEPVESGGDITGFKNQKISYEVAFNQTIEINTNAGDVYKHGIGRDVDELVALTKKVTDADDKIRKVKEMMESYADDTPEYQQCQRMLDAANKERDLLKDDMQKAFAGAITKFAKYQEDLNDVISHVGSMRKRLEITENRVQEQRQNFKELSDQNINIDLTESAIDLTSAKTALEAAQLAAGKISQQSLLNYI